MPDNTAHAQSSRIRPVRWSISYLFRWPFGISIVTSKFTVASLPYVRARLIAILCVLVVLAGAALVWERRTAAQRTSGPPTAAPSLSPSPSPAPSPVTLAAAPPEGVAPTGAGIAAALRGALADPALGGRVAVLVADAGGTGLYERDADTRVVPASTAKLATALAALQVLDPDTRFATRAVSSGADLVLVGGGDPTLARTPASTGYPRPAALADLARRVARSGVRRVARVVADGTLFTGPRLGPGWKPAYVTEGSVAPVTALMLDGGRIPRREARSPDPDLAAGIAFRDERRRAGVVVSGAVVRGQAPPGAPELARVESPPVPALVEQLLARSDNDLAEALGRHVALALGEPASFAGAGAAVSATAGVEGLQDASGLSRLNRMAARELVTLLSRAVAEPRLRPALTALPVAGFTGTLSNRYAKGAAARAAGWVRAKTGSLDNVATLAGVVQTGSGRLLLFAFAADRLPTRFVGAAAQALDRAAAALATCGC